MVLSYITVLKAMCDVLSVLVPLSMGRTDVRCYHGRSNVSYSRVILF